MEATLSRSLYVRMSYILCTCTRITIYRYTVLIYSFSCTYTDTQHTFQMGRVPSHYQYQIGEIFNLKCKMQILIQFNKDSNCQITVCLELTPRKLSLYSLFHQDFCIPKVILFLQIISSLFAVHCKA